MPHIRQDLAAQVRLRAVQIWTLRPPEECAPRFGCHGQHWPLAVLSTKGALGGGIFTECHELRMQRLSLNNLHLRPSIVRSKFTHSPRHDAFQFTVDAVLFWSPRCGPPC